MRRPSGRQWTPPGQDGVAKPSLEQVLALAPQLDKNSPVAEIEKVLVEAAKAGLEPLARDKVLSTIQKQAGSRIKPLRQQLALIEQELGLHPGDPALDLARMVRADHFNGGAHLRRCADGSYWVYTCTHWRETTNEALRRIILEDAGSQVLLGVLYDTGLGVQRDYQAATNYYLLGLQHGCTAAESLFGEAWPVLRANGVTHTALAMIYYNLAPADLRGAPVEAEPHAGESFMVGHTG